MPKKRSIYLEDLPMSEAWERFVSALSAADLWGAFPGEAIPLHEALGRVTAEPVWARLSAPHYHASAVDGYAVYAGDTQDATETHAVSLTEIQADADIEGVERPAQAVNTGHPLPAWANAVIMIEHVQPSDGALLIRASVAPWQHVRAMGEDMVATQLVLPANHRIRPVDLGAIAGSGHATVSVRRRPRVAIIPTGSELISAEHAAEGQLYAGQIIEYNSLVLGAQISEWGGVPTRWPIVADEYDAIKQAVTDAAQDHDLVLINAGSSAGSEDYTIHVVRELGEALVHGIAIRPGHPVIFGMIHLDDRQVPIIGVPGYPVSAALTGEIFVQRMLSRWAGQPAPERPQISGTLSRKINSPPGDDDFVRVTVGRVDDQVIVTPLARGAGVISSLVRADGIVRVPRFSEGQDAGDQVLVDLYRQPPEIDRTIVAIGSHDLTLDLLAQFLAERAPGMRLTSANVGSLGGLVALRRAEAHLAGAHLLDPETGTTNWPYIERYLPNADIRVITLVERQQGLIVPPGNPKGIADLTDLPRHDLQFVNRQQGAGTRVLLDYLLDQSEIEAERISGYEREEYTHLAVAAAVASGAADCGLGIQAAARALELDFVPIAEERYDLVIPRQHAESELLRPLLDLLADADFRAAIAALPGYSTARMGQVVERPG
ncbi:MAG: molybdopterin biosynthesis protein [Chloroflexi bacterium]|nr:molybdopterin biosynthesis protein [Chloroflexota bacterium]